MFDLGNKILIIGCAGSGKTTLSKKLQLMTGLPILHLDKYYWTECWSPKDDTEWEKIVNELCHKPKWIMDGNYTKTMSARFKYATTVIYLDMPRWQCLLRVIIRCLHTFRNNERDDLPIDCKERMNLAFYRWIWNYPKRSRGETLKLLNTYTGHAYYLKSKLEVTQFIGKLLM